MLAADEKLGGVSLPISVRLRVSSASASVQERLAERLGTPRAPAKNLTEVAPRRSEGAENFNPELGIRTDASILHTIGP